MNLKCRPGDLAIVCNGHTSTGRIVNVVRLMGPYEPIVDHTGEKHEIPYMQKLQMWEIAETVDAKLRCIYGEAPPTYVKVQAVADEHLQPIRDDEGEDETLRWADVPKWRLYDKAELS